MQEERRWDSIRSELLVWAAHQYNGIGMRERRDSWILRILDKINPNYEDFTTVFWKTIYLPENWHTRGAKSKTATLAHELQHVEDRWWSLLYLLPHLLGIIPIIIFAAVSGWTALVPLFAALCIYSAYALSFPESTKTEKIAGLSVSTLVVMICGIAATGGNFLWAVLGAALISPLPNYLGLAYFRAKFEAKGYAVGMYVMATKCWNFSTDLEARREEQRINLRVQDLLSGSAYYWAAPKYLLRKIWTPYYRDLVAANTEQSAPVHREKPPSKVLEFIEIRLQQELKNPLHPTLPSR